MGDEVDCGSGRDVAVADREDRTASCEWVVDALPAGPFVLVKVDQRFGAPKGVPRSKACRGTMRLDLFRGRDRVARATVRVDRTCRYRKTFAISERRVGSAERLRLAAQFSGNSAVAPGVPFVGRPRVERLD